MKKTITVLILCILSLNLLAQKRIEVASPDGMVKISVDIADKIYYTISANSLELLTKNCI